jgi:hypothetical protein
MWLSQLRNLVRGRWPARRTQSQRPGGQLLLEQLEDRLTPANFTAASVPELIADINAANTAGGSNTITLTAPTTAPYVLTAVDNGTNGANGLPVITNGKLTIVGNGDTIERNNSLTTSAAFRLMDVARGGSLTLENLVLQDGKVVGSGSAAAGGALYNQGTLVLSGVTLAGNTAEGAGGFSGGNAAYGGAIWSNGALTLENGTVLDHNAADGGFASRSGRGGNAFGGGLYIAGGTLTLTSTTLTINVAQGQALGNGYGGLLTGPPGTGFGGGLYVAGGTVTLSNDTVTYNTASGTRYGGSPSYGGGLYLATGSTVYLDAFTLNNTINNRAQYDPNIHGHYTLI